MYSHVNNNVWYHTKKYQEYMYMPEDVGVMYFIKLFLNIIDIEVF